MIDFECSDSCPERQLYHDDTVDFAARRKSADIKAGHLLDNFDPILEMFEEISTDSAEGIATASLLHASIPRLTRQRREELDSRIELLNTCAPFCELEGKCVLRTENSAYRFRGLTPPPFN